MPIGLTDFIKPKNDAFTGIVQASQVLGGGGNGTLPDATVAASSVEQHLLDEDDLVSDDATKAPTQQSTKAYVDAHIDESTDPHGSTLIQSSSVESPAFQNSSGQINISAIGDIILAALGNSDIDLVAVNSIADSTVSVKNTNATFKANLDVENNIIVGGTVDNRDVAADGTRLDTIEDNATADQSNAEIKTAYEANADTNEFSDAEQTKLAGIEDTADITDAANVNAAGAVMETDFAAKGDILTATADDTPVILSVGATDGHVLTVDAAEANGIKWAAAAGGGGANHDILDGSVHQDSVAQGVTRGSLIFGNATPKWDELVKGTSGQVLRSNGTDVVWMDHIEDITFNWPFPVTSPDPDEIPIGKNFPVAVTLIHVRMHVVVGSGTVDFQIYNRLWSTSGTGTTSIKTTGDFQASTTASTITALVTAVAAEQQLVFKAISQTDSPELVRVWIRYKLA